MEEAESGVTGRRRVKGAARASALERLKALRRPGPCRSESALQVKLEAPIYDTVAEDDYAALVAKRREAARDFIIDDDGLGYGDEGEEEDWTQDCLPQSSDDSDPDAQEPKKKKAPKKNQPPRKSPPPAPIGNHRISSMFTSSIFKKPRDDKAKGLASSESIVDDIIAEFAPDESDRERWRRGTPNYTLILKNSAPILRVRTEMQPDLPDQIEKQEPAIDLPPELSVEIKVNGQLNHSEDVAMEVKNELNSDVGFEGNSSRSKVETDGGLDASGVSNGVAKVEAVKSEEAVSLNAKVKVERDPALSAAAGWKAVRLMENGHGRSDAGVALVNGNNSLDASDFELNPEGSLPFYIIDAYEETYGANVGTLYLFGKVKVKKRSAYVSCCVIVRSMLRCIYAIPKNSVFPDNTIMELERSVTESQITPIAFRTKLQNLASQLKAEVASKLLDLNVSNFTMAPVKRGYAFERLDIPTGENYVLKVNYPFKDPLLPLDLRGEHFEALLGTNASALELFLVKRKIKGPSWLSISKFTSCPAPQRVSWCQYEVIVDCPKEIQVLTSQKAPQDLPPVVVTAINLKTIINEKHNNNEIVSASVICCHKARIDSPMVESEWTKSLSHFTVIRKLDGGIFPMGFAKEALDINSKASSAVLATETSERALLNRLLVELHQLDSDILVGHNISGFDLDVLLHRAQACKVPSSMWSKIGRLKRSLMPKLTKGSSIFGSGASSGILSCIAGRILCDTYLCSRDLLKEVSYSLTQLAKTQLNKDRKEIAPHDIPAMFQKCHSLLELVECGETDAWLSLELMFHLSVLPLTRQLTNISGNLWGKTLQGARSQRVEYLLLHEFHGKKYIAPDKIPARWRDPNSTKRRVQNAEDGDYLSVNDFENDAQHIDRVKGKKGPAYAGGLVLEPKKGLYDKYILLLDFNSLYPSIIQEYNICFTTVERSSEGSIPSLPSCKTTGVLPKLLKLLVERRRSVKKYLKTATGLKIRQLDIQQQALKLTANSIYGCLGFSNSRFYAKPLAELITLQGREILQNTVDLVQNNLNLEVIYGDTDSIMIYSGLDDITAAKAIAAKVIQEVNKKYRCLEIDLDGLYKRMLLLKKKKYAAVKVQFKDGTPYEVIERKGLDMVRRDWSLLSKELGDYCLQQILSGGSCEDVVESIHSALMKVQEEMKNGEIALEKYSITKTLTKRPEDYPDAKNQPHVQVALRLKQNGYSTGFSAGDTVPYIICCQQGSSSGSSLGIAQRARHPEELTKDNGNWIIDIEYYLSQQIHPVVARLCASIQGTSPARLADCLGLESSKFQSRTTEEASKDQSSSLLLGIADDDERYRGCEPLWLSCPGCSSTFECPPVSSLLPTSSSESSADLQAEKASSSNFWQRMHCLRCPDDRDGSKLSPVMLANQVKRQVEKFISRYYMGLMMCDDEMCKYTTRSLNLRVIGDSERGTVCPNYPCCNGRLVPQYTEVDLYTQLSYFCYILDAVRCIEKLEYSARMPLEKELTRVRSVFDLALSTVQKIRDRCAYGWVQLSNLTVSV